MPSLTRWLARSFASIAVTLPVVVAAGACGSSNPREVLVFQGDADATVEGGLQADAGARDAPAEADPTLGGPCVDDAQCDDGIKCTYDSCDMMLQRCRHIPDDAQCDDGVFCNGKEVCVVGHGCESGPPVTCEDGDACTIDSCVESSKTCRHAPRDLDQDGDPDRHCTGGHDCDDLDPTVSSLHAEVCANHKDDNCNGLVDETPCVSPAGATCTSAVAVGGAGTYALSTVGANKTFATSCSVPNPSAGRDVVAAVTVPAGPNVDLEVWATSTIGVPIAVAVDGTCGVGASELACGSGGGASSVRARARNVAAGRYYMVVTTQSESDVELKVVLLTPTPKATNVDCATAAALQPGVTTTVSIVDPPHDLPSACTSVTGELTYAVTLTQPQDVSVYTSTIQGSGSPVVGLRGPHCTDAGDEIACSAAGAAPIHARSLPAGTYVVTVAATAPIDLSLQVALSAPTPPPPDQTCTAPPAIAADTVLSYDLSPNGSAIPDGCFPGGPDAAFDLTLTAASDVLLVSRFPLTESGGLSLDVPGCTASGRLACATGTAPLRAGARNLPAGEYRVVVADTLGLQGAVEAIVRPTVAPTIIPAGGAGTCAQAQPIDVAAGGGFYTGDITTATTDYGSGCDSPSSPPPGGSPDQVLSLVLSQPARLVLDMEGSSYETILDVRQGPGCPGTPVNGSTCYVGFGPSRSFLDLELQPGSYWVLVSGYDNQRGAWDLDVRVLPP
jgi:hypothetical protein